MAHHGLEQLSRSLSYLLDTEYLSINEVDCSEHRDWSRGQTDIYGLFCEFVAPPRKKNLVTIFS